MTKIKFKLKTSISIYLLLFIIIIFESYYIYKTSEKYLIYRSTSAQTIKYDNQVDFLTPKPTPTATATPTATLNTNTNTNTNTDKNTNTNTTTEQMQQNTTDNNQYNPENYTPIPNKNYSYTFYYQCSNDFGSYKLPQGCDICKAGCGPTTVAMILSTFIDKSWTPIKVIESFYEPLSKTNKYYIANCNGTYISAAKEILSRYFDVGNYIFASEAGYELNMIIKDMKMFINNGYYIFALANFNNYGHFFWIVDIDENNNVWAYDPYYSEGRLVPLNENSFYPDPKYRLAFPFKKR
ncbi:MAG: hypothetical protein KatS3mg090_0772 [Patescibacteria group bacterium]|nr:MAG: hypothetical protein KatS3mg090_0772 [Patescibacteria group bacterium]